MAARGDSRRNRGSIRLLPIIGIALVLELALLAAFWGDADNWDCGGPCGTGTEILGAFAFGIVPVATVELTVVAAVRAFRRRRLRREPGP